MCHVNFLGQHDLFTLTSDLVSRIILSVAYLLLFLGRNPKLGVCMHLGMAECRIPF